MTMTPDSPASRDAPIAAGVTCARCGYDVRGLTSGRCPECGADLAAQHALANAIPWPARRSRGRVRAFVRTAWDVLAGAPWTRAALVVPVAMPDARRFWLAAVAIVAAIGVATFLGLTRGDVSTLLAVPNLFRVAMPGAFGPLFRLTFPHWWGVIVPASWPRAIDVADPSLAVATDVVWPLSVGWSTPGVGPLAIALAVLFGSGAAAYWFHPRELDDARRRRLAALAYYQIGATLAAVAVPLAATVAAGLWMTYRPGPRLGSAALVFAVGAMTTGAAATLGLIRMRGAIGTATGRIAPALLAAVGIPVTVVLAASFALVAVTWTIGYARLLLDAL